MFLEKEKKNLLLVYKFCQLSHRMFLFHFNKNTNTVTAVRKHWKAELIILVLEIVIFDIQSAYFSSVSWLLLRWKSMLVPQDLITNEKLWNAQTSNWVFIYIGRVLCSIHWYTQFSIAALKDVIKAQLLLVLSKIQWTCFRNWLHDTHGN